MKRTIYSVLTFLFLSASSFGAILINETFSYPDGALTTVSGGNWINHSGTALEQTVSNGCVILQQTKTEDTHRNFTAQASGAVWTGVDVKFTALPLAGAGTYFLHYSDGMTSTFRGRVFASITGAAAGKFRIGIAENLGPANFVTSDLSLNTVYRVLLKTNVADMDSMVEVVGLGTASQADASAVATMNAINLRQANNTGGMGELCVDNLIVGTSREEVVPEPASLFGLGSAVALLGVRRRRRK